MPKPYDLLNPEAHTSMNKLLLTLLMAAFSFSYSDAQIGKIQIANVGSDSLKVLVKKHIGLDLFIKIDKGDDSLKFSFNCGQNDLLKETSRQLEQKGYSITIIGNSLFILKGAGIMKALPDDYFHDKNNGSNVKSDYLDAISTNGQVAGSENKIYKVGDPNFPKKSGRALLRGYVRNQESGEPLSGVTVMIEKPNTVVTTDRFGFYRILLPIGVSDLILKGYGLVDSKLMLEVSGDGEMDIAMKDKIYSLKEFVLTAESAQKVRTTQMGMEKVKIDRIKHIPSVFGEADVMKVVLTLPGVKSVGEASGGFNVRGGATDQNLILFNDGTLYNPTHLFGLFSAFNPDVVEDVELYKSTIPAKFGGRISSVLEINSRNGVNNKITGSAGIGLLTSKFHIEGPIVKNKTNFIAGVRTTYSNWILGVLPKESGYRDGKASFNDVTLGLSHKFDKSNTVYLYGYYSGDGFKFTADTSYRYQNINASVKWRNIISDKHNMLVSAGYDQYSYSNEESGNPINGYIMKFNIRQMFLKTNFNTLLNEKHSLNYGLNSLFYNVSPGTMTPASDESLVASKIMDKEKAVELALYLSDSWTLSDRLSVDLGLRYSFYSAVGPRSYYRYLGENRGEDNITDTISVGRGGLVKPYYGPEIRVSARYSITDDLSLKAGYNSMRQYIHMLSNTTAVSPTDIWKLSDANIAPQEGWQAAFGVYRNVLRGRVELSVEGYYKEMNKYLDYKSGAVLNMNENIERDVLTTRGKAYGIEVMAKKTLGKLNGWLAYTYSRTQLKESGKKEVYTINKGDWYSASYDKPHDLKLISNYKFTQRFSISVNMDYSSGRPVTVPISKYFYGNGYRLYYSERNAYRIPDYFRMDVSVNVEPSHHITLLTHSTITIGVYNLTGRKNAFSVYYDSNNGTKIRGYKLSIYGAPIPYVNYNIKF